MSSSLIETAHDDDLGAYIAQMAATDNAYFMRNSNDRFNVSVTVSTAVQAPEPRGRAASTRVEV